MQNRFYHIFNDGTGIGLCTTVYRGWPRLWAGSYSTRLPSGSTGSSCSSVPGSWWTGKWPRLAGLLPSPWSQVHPQPGTLQSILDTGLSWLRLFRRWGGCDLHLQRRWLGQRWGRRRRVGGEMDMLPSLLMWRNAGERVGLLWRVPIIYTRVMHFLWYRVEGGGYEGISVSTLINNKPLSTHRPSIESILTEYLDQKASLPDDI